MNRLFNASLVYMIAGILAGLFYREFTKVNEWPAGQFTQLGVLHTHLLMLGFFAMLIFLCLEKLFSLSSNAKMFSLFFWTYNAGVAITCAMLAVHGSLTVLGHEKVSLAISGIAGLGHITITAGLAFFFVLLKGAIKNSPVQESPAAVPSAQKRPSL